MCSGKILSQVEVEVVFCFFVLCCVIDTLFVLSCWFGSLSLLCVCSVCGCVFGSPSRSVRGSSRWWREEEGKENRPDPDSECRIY